MIPRYGEWDERYGDQGLTVLGVHSAETDCEADPKALARFVKARKIRWKVIPDPDLRIWKKYEVDAWPSIVLVDR